MLVIALEDNMRVILLCSLLVMLTACNTTAGVLSGVGKDLQSASELVTPKEKVPLK